MKKGQSLLEVILALAIFSMIAGVLASMAVGGMTALVTGGDLTRADALATEAIEKVRAVRDGAWNAITQPAQEIINSRYTRDVTITNVGMHTKNIKAKVSWESRPGVTNSVERETYLSNWDSKTWVQTDWSGGQGQAAWSNATKFDSISPADSIEYGTVGEIRLKSRSVPGTWSRETAADILPLRQLNAIDIVDPNNIFIIGNTLKFLRYQSGLWSQITVPVRPLSVNFLGINMLSPQEGWLVGSSGKIVKYNNGSWTDMDTGNQTWNGISMVNASEGWAVGNGGAIAHYTGGTSWVVLPPPVSENLNGVYMLSATDGWAVGASGKIIRYQNGAWTATANGATDTGGNVWQSVFMLNASQGWAVGNLGLIYKWNGSAWTQMLDTGGEIWYGVRALAGNDIWIVGSSGNIGYWNGGTWTIQAPSGTNVLRALDIYKNSDTSVTGFAVGDSNTVLRFTRPPLFATLGELISSAFDMTDASPVQVLEWIENNPCAPTCKVRIQISTENSSGAMNWRGPDGTVATYFEGATPILIPISFNGFRWLRYKIRLEGGPGSNTPKLEEIKINYK